MVIAIHSDPDQDGIWTASYTFDRGTLLEYKYLVDNWAGQEDLVDDASNGATCAPVADYYTYMRFFSLVHDAR